jgi:dipeptidyl aminopeptidase/acylaminoacyl peptidase
MSRFTFVVLPMLGALLMARSATAQGTRADYDRANHLGQITQHTVFNASVTPHWASDGNSFWYRNDTPDGHREFVWVDAVAGTRGPAFDHEKLAAALGSAMKKKLDANQLPVTGIEKGEKPGQLIVNAGGKRWGVDVASYEVTALAGAGNGANADSLPVLTRMHPSETGEESSITFVNHTDGSVKLFWVDLGGKRVAYGTIEAGAKFEQNTYAGHVWVVTDAAGRRLAAFEAVEGGGEAVIEPRPAGKPASPEVDEDVAEVPPPATAPAAKAPARKWEAVVENFNVFLRDRASGEKIALTTDGTKGDSYDGDFIWSPDGKKFVALKTLDGDHRKVYVVQSSPPDQLQPKLESYDYLKPGDRIPMSKPHLFDVEQKKQIAVSDQLFPTPWEVDDVRWDADSSRFTFFYNQRGHQVLRIIAVDAATGEAKPVVDETSKTFIDYSGKMFVHYLDKTHEIIWMSERDGWNHLYLYDAKTSSVKNQITKGEWVVRKVDRVDEAKRQIWFEAGGIRPGQDPYFIHFCRVNFDGTGLVVLTEGDGNHHIDFSPDKRFFVDTYSRMDMAPVTELRRTEDGSLAIPLEKGDMTHLLAIGWQLPERFVAKGRDGTTDIYGVIYRPMGFDPAKKYPVIEDIYAGPQDSFVPKTFSRSNSGMAMAQLGFVVVQIDGMGTSNRSKAFHDVCWRNLGDSGFPDRILWMKAAAKDRPWMDLTRVGIYGTSAGGQSALRAVEAFGNFYTAAVADCGCHDNRMDKIWWNEQWMGWPIGPWYAEQSNVTNAKDLHGALLLIVGETDHNVDPASTMQVVNALIKADKDFDLLVIPNADHGQDGEYGDRRRKDFFVRHLLGVEPRS